MSLLQEALKRKETDAAQPGPVEATAQTPAKSSAENTDLPGGRSAAVDGNNPVVSRDSPPQSMPVAGQTQTAPSQSIRRKTSFLWVIVAVMAIAIGLTVTGGVVFLLYRCFLPMNATIGQPAPHIGKTGIVTGDTDTAAGQPIPAQTRARVGEAETTAHPFVASDVKDIEKISSAATAQTVAVIQNAGTNIVQQPSAAGDALKPFSIRPALFKPRTPAASSSAVRWPVLKLTGILRGSGTTESTALINGKIVGAGQTIENVTIVEIQSEGVFLKFGAEKRFLRVGAASY